MIVNVAAEGEGRAPENREEPPEEEWEAPASETPLDEAWVTAEVLSEIYSLELAMRDGPECPRCSSASFEYGRIRFCSRGCPENLLISEPVEPFE